MRRQTLYSILNFIGSQCSEANTGEIRSLLHVGSFKCSSSQGMSCNRVLKDLLGQLERGEFQKPSLKGTNASPCICLTQYMLDF